MITYYRTCCWVALRYTVVCHNNTVLDEMSVESTPSSTCNLCVPQNWHYMYSELMYMYHNYFLQLYTCIFKNCCEIELILYNCKFICFSELTYNYLYLCLIQVQCTVYMYLRQNWFNHIPVHVIIFSRLTCTSEMLNSYSGIAGLCFIYMYFIMNISRQVKVCLQSDPFFFKI